MFNRNDEGEVTGATWQVSCKSDPRFNASGWSYGAIGAAVECKEHIKRTIKRLGLKPEEVPTDIEYGGGKP
jgi:hypothetical protein